MELAKDTSTQLQIQAYTPGKLIINNQAFINPIILFDGDIQAWPVTNLLQLTSNDLSSITDHKPEIVLFGSGSQLEYPAQPLLCELNNHGIGFEIMHTAAACRTLAILLADRRRVLAALIV